MLLGEFFVSEKEIILKPGEEYITLNILLKITRTILSGGMAKIYLAESPVKVNGELENRRGRKLYSGDKIELEDKVYVIKAHDC